MATLKVNGVRLFYRWSGDGIPVVLVHGSWVSHRHWDGVAEQLARSFRVVRYDRRGHSGSERVSTQGSVHEDVADLAGLIEHLGLDPCYVAGNSFGGDIALRLGAQRPDLVRGVIAHEPPLFALLGDDPALAPLLDETARQIDAVAERIRSGDHAGAAEQFAETVALGPGGWARASEEFRQIFIGNAPTFLDETQDPDQLTIDLDGLRALARPVLLTLGDQGPPTFAPVVWRLAEVLPAAKVLTFPGAGHIPHVTHPRDYVEAVSAFVAENSRVQAFATKGASRE